jgi:hypothetical protein
MGRPLGDVIADDWPELLALFEGVRNIRLS